jgi:c-di-GMP-binding flagellar brake protein YcgR
MNPGAAMSDQSRLVTENTEQVDDLAKLDLGIGDALQLQDNAGDRLRYFSRLIGFLNGAGIIVSHPLRDNVPLPIEEGQGFSVRGFSGRKVYEFNTRVLVASASPYPHLHLAYPEKIECITVRDAMRTRPKSLVGWAEPMGIEPGVVKMPMVIVDLSTSGARVHAKRQIGNIDDLITVMFRVPVDGDEQVLSVLAVIRKSYSEKLPEEMGGAEVITYGLEFMNPAGRVRMALQGYIYKTMIEGGG